MSSHNPLSSNLVIHKNRQVGTTNGSVQYNQEHRPNPKSADLRWSTLGIKSGLCIAQQAWQEQEQSSFLLLDCKKKRKQTDG